MPTPEETIESESRLLTAHATFARQQLTAGVERDIAADAAVMHTHLKALEAARRELGARIPYALFEAHVASIEAMRDWAAAISAVVVADPRSSAVMKAGASELQAGVEDVLRMAQRRRARAS